MVWLGDRAQPVRARAHREGRRRSRRSRTQTSSPRGPAPTSPTSGPARCPARGFRPRTRSPEHKPLAIDKARHAGDGVAVVVARAAAAQRTRRSSSRSTTSRCRRSPTSRRRSRTARRSCTTSFGTNECYTWKLDAGEVERLFAEADVTVKRALPPEPADPERDRAARGVRAAAAGERRVHAVVDDAGPAHRAASRSAACWGSPSRSCA